MYVGIVVLIGLPVSYRTARIAAALKQRGLPPVSDDQQTIPPATAQAIITEVKQAAKSPQSNKTVAQQTLNIFEMLNARPPGWGATIGLLFVQVASIVVAGVFILVFYFLQTGMMLNFMANTTQLPKHKLAPELSQEWSGKSVRPFPENQDVILVGTFPSANAVVSEYQDLTNRLPQTAALKLFGESLLLTLPADEDGLRKQWLNELTSRTKDAFVDSTNYHAAFSLSCVAPDTNVAEAVVGELNDYFSTLPDESLVPPWEPQDTRTPEERALNELARQTYLKLQNSQSEIDDTNLENLESKLELAQKEGDGSSFDSIQKQIAVLRDSSARQNIEHLREGDRGPVDTNVIDLFVTLNSSEVETNQTLNEQIRKKLAQRMGQLSLTNGETDSFSAHFGTAYHNKLLVNLSFISFDRTDDGPPALAAWLQSKGCNGFKYDFLPGMGMNDGDSD